MARKYKCWVGGVLEKLINTKINDIKTPEIEGNGKNKNKVPC